MSYSYVQYTGNGATTNYAFSFPYLDSSHIKVRVNGTITSFTFVNSGTVQISPAPLTGTIIDIRRETPKDLAPVNFTDGSVLLEQDLDLLAAFNLYTAQESADGVADSITKDTLGVWDAQSRRIKSVADPVNANDAVNKTWAETGMTSQLSSATSQAAIATTKAGEAASSASSASTSASTATTKASEASASATSAGNSATSATASASTATTKASEALASQVAAAASASTASTKASEANTSAGNAASSATTAGTQAGIATTKATEASSSASAAATSAATATTKADSATASATAAAGSAATATTKASEASASATAAATSATNAASSATSASTSASTATTKASEAVVSASDAATSAVSAASSAASAAALLDNFDDRYLGSKTSAPTLDNDGNALLIGALYFDSTTGKMRVYTASGWLDASSASVATLAVFNYTATAGQTSFSGADIASQTLTYTVGSLFVTLNGIDLKNGTDYTATTGSSIVLASGAVAGDELRVYAFGSFLVADTYTRAQADAGFVAKDSATGAAVMPVGSTAQRPATPTSGMYRLNTTSGEPEWYDTTSSSWVTFSRGLPYTIEYVVVGGGGGGGYSSSYESGGGGAGGVITSTASVFSGIGSAITIGAGGGSNAQGGSTTAFSLTALGGGVGGTINGGSGGSGGGGGATGSASAGTVGQGYAGGNGANDGTNFGGGGGGGASGVGGNGSTGGGGTGGNGGPGFVYTGTNGYALVLGCGGGGGSRQAAGNPSTLGLGGAGATITSTSSGTTLTVTAVSSGSIQLGQWIYINSTTNPVYISAFGTGNGGVGTYTLSASYSGSPTILYNGGLGGGEQTTRNGMNGAAYTGSGGGGAHGYSASFGGNGGAGVVVVRYLGSQRGSGGTVTSSGGYTYHTFTSSGTFTA